MYIVQPAEQWGHRPEMPPLCVASPRLANSKRYKPRWAGSEGSNSWKKPMKPWKDPPVLIGKPRKTIYKWAIYTMAMLNNQRVSNLSFIQSITGENSVPHHSSTLSLEHHWVGEAMATFQPACGFYRRSYRQFLGFPEDFPMACSGHHLSVRFLGCKTSIKIRKPQAHLLYSRNFTAKIRCLPDNYPLVN